MNKGLEALKEYRSQQQGVNVYANDYLNIVEKELKDYETFKTGLILGNMSIVDNKIPKALEIIKRKVVLIDVLVESENVNDYNEFVSKSKDRHLTQEEYDLLKEVLA